MNKTAMYITIAAFLIGGVLGGFVHSHFWPPPDTSELHRALDARQAQVDTLKSANVHLLNMIDADRVEIHTDTVTVRIQEKLRWSRAAGMDTIARDLFTDPL